MILGVLLQVPRLQNDGRWPTLSETRYHFRIFLVDLISSPLQGGLGIPGDLPSLTTRHPLTPPHGACHHSVFYANEVESLGFFGVGTQVAPFKIIFASR